MGRWSKGILVVVGGEHSYVGPFDLGVLELGVIKKVLRRDDK